jgi:hypothetical protein
MANPDKNRHPALPMDLLTTDADLACAHAKRNHFALLNKKS